MRTSLLYLSAFVFLVASPALFSQSNPAPAPLLRPWAAPETHLACGPKHARFSIRLDPHPFTPSQPPSGLARVYLITETQGVPLAHTPSTRIGMDGRWVGANHSFSYLSLDVPPGRHLFCAAIAWRGIFIHAPGSIALASLHTHAGHTYYLWNYSMGAGDEFTLDRVNPDEASMLLQSAPLSISHPK